MSLASCACMCMWAQEFPIPRAGLPLSVAELDPAGQARQRCSFIAPSLDLMESGCCKTVQCLGGRGHTHTSQQYNNNSKREMDVGRSSNTVGSESYAALMLCDLCSVSTMRF